MLPPIIAKTDWDFIIVGTGMGGATLGYALAQNGKKVLFCEQGRSSAAPGAIRGSYAESEFERSEVAQPKHHDILLRSGRSAETIEDVSRPRHRQFIPFIGAGAGGSSALYGMALERFFPCDFAPKANFPDAADSNLPENWPITYHELEPYYAQAEQLFKVRGTADPLRPNGASGSFLEPPALSLVGGELNQFLTARGFHPYRIPLACEYVPGCECCQGYLCAKDCKNDSSRMCLAPALEKFGAQILDECEVMKLEADQTKITGIVCSWRGERIMLRGKVIVLAAGALRSPAILLNSASSLWPKGLANDSGLVGKNLMRHLIDLYVVFPKTTNQFTPMKELAFNDFYRVDGEKFGSVQTFGAMPSTEIITAGLEQQLAESAVPFAAPLFRSVRPVVDAALTRLFAGKTILASILEDLPYNDNQVSIEKSQELDRPRMMLKYNLTEYDQRRVDRFRKRVRAALKSYRVFPIKQAENNERIAHACGTCRFGSNPATSVLDSMNRAHSVTNLYIVDGSFFPSSGGINPALTIAANALRVADHLTHEL
jgi:choline dehydrogenase-like flavoprotein